MNASAKKIIIATNYYQLRFALKLIKPATEAVIVTDTNVKLGNNNIKNIRPVDSYKTSGNIKLADIWKDFCLLFINWADVRLRNSSTLRDLTKYDGISLWEISSQELLKELTTIIDKINGAEEALKAEVPAEVIIFNSKGLLEKVFLSFCQTRRIPIRIHRAHKILGRGFPFPNLFFSIVEFSKKIKRFLVSARYCLSGFLRQRLKIQLKPKVIFFVSLERYLETLLPVINLFRQEERLVINLTLPGSAQKLRQENIFFAEFDGYILNYPFNKRVDKFLQKIWHTIESDLEFQKKLNYKDIPLWDLVREVFYNLIFVIFKNKMYRLDVVRKIIISYRPKVIVIPNNAPYIIQAARNLGVCTIAMQCASVSEFIYYGSIASDMVTVDGRHWKNLLVNYGVPESKILVAGPPRFDIVFKKKRECASETRRAFFNKMKIDKNKKLVVFAGTVEPSYGLSRLRYRDLIFGLYNTVKDLKNIQLLTKLHPYELYPRIHQEIARDTGLNNLIVVGDTDKWELLFACDLLISFGSTMGYEAIILDKPVINLEPFSLLDDMWNFKTSGAAICIDNLTKLKNAIENILFNPLFALRLQEKRRSYAQNYTDYLGKASVIVKKTIEDYTVVTRNYAQ